MRASLGRRGIKKASRRRIRRAGLRTMRIELLEARRLLSASLVDPAFAYGGILDPTAGETIFPDPEPVITDMLPAPAALAAPAAAATFPLTSVPTLDSLPGATDKIYLDFVGAPAMNWGGYSVPATPAYDIDGDPTTFSSTELANITQIWSIVAEKYAPFDIDVTTVDPSPTTHTYPHLQDAWIIIGGTNSWVGEPWGGVSYTNGFSAFFLPNISFVFPAQLSYSNTNIADAVAHEAGHQFGLGEQSLYSGTTLVNEFNPGNALTAPIMGDPYNSARAIWWDGPSDEGSTDIQDNMAIISSATNGFGYRPDENGDSIATAGPLAVSGTSVLASGVIDQTTDADVFSFTTGAGSITLNVNVAQYGAMLHAQEILETGSGSIIASADNASTLGQTITTTVAAGTYYLFVESYGQYGDVGQYTVSGNVAASAPTVAIVAAATPNPLTGTSINLSVLGADAGGQSNLTYTWSATGPATVNYSNNGTNSAQNTTATFTQAGTYTFTATITNSSALSATSIINVTVGQSLTSITVTPTSPTMADRQIQQFSATALDQFGNAMSNQPNFIWSIDAGSAGSIDSTGLYSAPVSGPGSATVRATSGAVSGTSAVTVQLTDIDGTSGDDNIRLVRSGSSLDVYINNPAMSAYSVPFASLGALIINGDGGNDAISVDFSGGACPIPSAGLNVVDAGGSATLTVIGATGANTGMVDANSMVFDSSTINYEGVDSLVVNADGTSNDTLTQAQSGGPALTLVGTNSTDTLNVNGGTFSIPAPISGSGINSLQLAALNLSASAKMALQTAAAPTDRTVLVLGALSIAAGGQLDLGGNDLIVHNGNLSNITHLIGEGFNTGGTMWAGKGITSSMAAAVPDRSRGGGTE
jgi:hypothetical protein